MNSIGQSLTTQQKNDLAARFCIYDKETWQPFTDFSSLPEAVFIIFAEQASTRTSHENHQWFFKEFLEGRRSCILVKNYPAEEKLKADDCPMWPQLPKGIELRGSQKGVAKELIALCRPHLLAKEELVGKYAAFRKDQGDKVINLAETLNRLFLEGAAAVIPEGLLVNPEIIQKAENLLEEWDLLRLEIIRLERQIPKKQQTLESIDEKLIIKTCKQFEKVCTFWTFEQIENSNAIFDQLKQEKISFIILVPTDAKIEESEQELRWQRRDLSLIQLPLVIETECKLNGGRVEKSYEIATLLFSNENKNFFHPSIRSIMHEDSMISS